MKLPWKNTELNEKIEELKASIEKKEMEIEKLEDMLEAEKKRRKKNAREKQEAEEELNRLKDKLRNLKSEKQEEHKNTTERPGMEPASFDRTLSMLEKLDSLESRKKDLVTVYSPSRVEDLNDLRGLKNSISKNQYSRIEGIESFTAFLDQDTGNTVLETRPFLDSRFEVEEFFDVRELLEFIKSEKIWVLVSAGNTRIFREKDGEFEEIKSVKSRVDREHSKGGFSQGRFERKRDEQIEKHIDQVKEKLQDFEEDDLYLLGTEKMSEELPGEYLGGFDPNRKKPEQFYRFQVIRF
jgi:uncharacterized protein YqgV (UPF0045/DUF77 family)